MAQPQRLSRSFDHLGMLGTNLRNLTGIRSLAHELIQNADDSSQATTISFDFKPEGLIVQNDGEFSDCGSRNLPQCAGPPLGKPRCDFHSFRQIAGGAKRSQEGTTGAFGIGFTAVYQITDRPELISSGAHWIVDEMQREEDRILVCPGCSSCSSSSGTTFILPWASDPDSLMRQALRNEAVDLAAIPAFVQEVRDDALDSLLFLRRLDQLNLREEGQLVTQVDRHVDHDDVIISDGREDRVFHLLRGDFEAASAKLRDRFGTSLEDTRESSVAVAVPETDLDGLIYAFLPTEIPTHLGCHVQADFFPTSDRKQLIFEADYQSDWNRQAMLAAAETLAVGLPRIRDLLGEERIWKILSSAFQLHQSSTGSREAHWRDFWDKARNVAQRQPVTMTSTGTWRPLADVTLIELPSTQDLIPLLEALEVPTVAPSIRSTVFSMRGEAGVSPTLLSPSHLAEGFKRAALTARCDVNGMPAVLHEDEMRSTLLRELGRMLDRRSAADRERELILLGACAIFPGSDGAMWPPTHLYRADANTRELLERLHLQLTFLEESGIPQEARGLLDLSSQVTAADVTTFLAEVDPDTLRDTVQQHDDLVDALLAWFSQHRDSLDVVARQSLATLPIYPSQGSLHPLTTLSLPGNFEDPLRLAGILDTARLEGHLDFIRWLGANDLSLHSYSVMHIPAAIERGISKAELEMLVTLLAEHVGDLLGDEEAHDTLEALPLVQCADGERREASACYFADANVGAVLGPHIRIAPPGHPAQRELLTWLGVASQPRAADVRDRLIELTRETPTGSTRDAVVRVFDHLATRADELSSQMDDWVFLRELSWLPADGTDQGWYQPDSIYATFSRHLFESEAKFLAIPLSIQRLATRLMEVLPIESQPTTQQMVNHLQHQAANKLSVNPEVYRRLSEHAAEPEVATLIGTPCLQIGDRYVLPRHTFWQHHPFGGYRYQLSEQLMPFRPLLDVLDVRNEPDCTDAVDVLLELSNQFAPGNEPLDENTHSILLSCWRLIQEASPEDREQAVSSLMTRKSVPDRNGVLSIPRHLLFRDDQYLAAHFQSDLGASLIEREAGVWPAMERAGVRLLSQAVRRSLIAVTDSTHALDLSERVNARALQLTRVVQSLDPDSNANLVMQRLSELEFLSCRSIEVELVLEVPGQQLTQSEGVAAFFDSDSRTISAVAAEVPHDKRYNWVAFSRELARACCPDEEPGRYTLGFKEVLTADTSEAADAALDEAGIASLAATVIEDLPSETITGLGDGTSDPAYVAEYPSSSDEPPHPQADDLETSAGSSEGTSADSPHKPGEDRTTHEAEPGAPDPSRSSDRDEASRPRLSKPIAVITVIPGEPSEAEPDLAAERWRNEVDQAGIARVLEFERAAGRLPSEMSHGNPGYDVESRDDRGNLLRYIEVKSLGGEWAENVAMTDVQFRFAQAKGPQAWLYVVADAPSKDGPPPVCIQDPAGTATRFRFDRGWGGLAEPSDAKGSLEPRHVDLLPGTEQLLSALDRRGVPTPTIPYWIAGPTGESEWKAEAAWPDHRVIVCEESDSERDEWLSIQGWTIVLPHEWDVDEVAELLGMDDGKAPTV